MRSGGRISMSLLGDEESRKPSNDTFSIRYKVLEEIGEGSYSKVLKCRLRESGELFACKRLKQRYPSWTSVAEIPEIVTLRKLVRHQNILQMLEIHYDPGLGRVNLVFEIMDMNLYELIKDRKRLLQEGRVRKMIFQLIRALRHLHKNGIFHRDVKPENILIRRTEDTEEDLLKLGDLGSVRGLYSRPPYTEYISTRWYRSPECLLTAGFYSTKMDIWATGCVFFEVLTLRPLFPGISELDQINRIHSILGPPPPKILHKFLKHAEERRGATLRHPKEGRFESIKKTLTDLHNGNTKTQALEWHSAGKEGGGGGVERFIPNHISPAGKELLASFLQYDPELRPTAHRAIAHDYFKGLSFSSLSVDKDVSWNTKEALQPDVVVCIGTSIKKLSELDGSSPDLRTLGDANSKQTRHPKEVSSKIPVLKLQPEVMSLPKLSNNNIHDTKPTPYLQHEEAIGKKVRSYEEFSSNSKTKASHPYEVVNLHHLKTREPDDSTTIPSQENSGHEKKLNCGQTLNPTVLRRINHNRRLLNLQLINEDTGTREPSHRTEELRRPTISYPTLNRNAEENLPCADPRQHLQPRRRERRDAVADTQPLKLKASGGSLLHYQNFSERYKQEAQEMRRKREDKIHSDSSSAEKDLQIERRKKVFRTEFTPLVQSKVHLAEEPKQKKSVTEKIVESIGLFDSRRERDSLERLRCSVERKIKAGESMRAKGQDFPKVSMRTRLSEGVLPRLRKGSDEGRPFPVYPSHGKIRVSKPSLLLHPPPMRQTQAESNNNLSSSLPQSHLTTQSTCHKPSRDTLPRKKYVFLHEKEDFLLFGNKKSKFN